MVPNLLSRSKQNHFRRFVFLFEILLLEPILHALALFKDTKKIEINISRGSDWEIFLFFVLCCEKRVLFLFVFLKKGILNLVFRCRGPCAKWA